MAKSKLKLQPLGGRILVEAIEEEDGLSIVIPDSAKEETKPQKGVVVALGTGRILEDGSRADFNLKVGDVIFFKQYSPDECTVDEDGEEKTYLIMEESDVLAVVATK